MSKLNLTCLDPYELVEKRGLIHRDYLAHLFRFAFVGKLIKRGQSILDVGAGKGKLAETLYRNKMKPSMYLALELKQSYIAELKKLSSKVNFPLLIWEKDIRVNKFPADDDCFDVVCCFEVIEHFESYHEKPEYLTNVLLEMKRCVKPDGVILLSTPAYDGVHKAKNHIYEYRLGELEVILNYFNFKIIKQYGTFMSLGTPSQAKKILTPSEWEVYRNLHSYYNSSILSILFAPLHPKQSRNVLWVLKKQGGM